MSADAIRIVQKLWSSCTVLGDDGLFCGDDLEQLSVWLFRKAQNSPRDPAKLSCPIGDLPDKEQWGICRAPGQMEAILGDLEAPCPMAVARHD